MQHGDEEKIAEKEEIIGGKELHAMYALDSLRANDTIPFW